ncbi:MAG: hypothetical protein ACK5NG_02425 [Chthoniobacterales bacterium]
MKSSHHSPPWRKNFTRSAFSLVEITIALGIIAFALVGIMGLLPVAMRAANESQWETRATFIAESIMGELRSSSPDQTFIATAATDPASWESGPGRLSVNLAANNTYYILYDDEGEPVGTQSGASPVASNSPGVFLAQVSIQQQAAPMTNLSRVNVRVEVPASAPANRRSLYHFVTLLKNTP